LAGQSNALAVAQGLGFSGEVLREARAIAADMRAVTDTQPRNETLAVSLEEQLHESQARLCDCRCLFKHLRPVRQAVMLGNERCYNHCRI